MPTNPKHPDHAATVAKLDLLDAAYETMVETLAALPGKRAAEMLAAVQAALGGAYRVEGMSGTRYVVNYYAFGIDKLRAEVVGDESVAA